MFDVIRSAVVRDSGRVSMQAVVRSDHLRPTTGRTSSLLTRCQTWPTITASDKPVACQTGRGGHAEASAGVSSWPATIFFGMTRSVQRQRLHVRISTRADAAR